MSAERKRSAAAIPPWEWIVAAVGLALVTTTLSFLAYKAVKGETSPPDISIRADEIVPLADRYLVKITASNRGDRTAADVKVEGELATPGGVVEKSEMTFTYLPGRSARSGGLYFTRDPRRHTLSLSAKGYENP